MTCLSTNLAWPVGQLSWGVPSWMGRMRILSVTTRRVPASTGLQLEQLPQGFDWRQAFVDSPYLRMVHTAEAGSTTLRR
jgi:hypothetical protein